MANAEIQALHVAKLAECLSAIQALTEKEVKKLNNYATLKTFTTPGVLYYAEGQDLLHEAITRTLDGRRLWRPEAVSFSIHLLGCIRSIASEYAEEAQRRSNAPDKEVLPEEERIWRAAILNEVRLLLKPHKLASDVFNFLLEGYSAREVRNLLCVNENVYNAARKRIVRYVQGSVSSREPNRT